MGTTSIIKDPYYGSLSIIRILLVLSLTSLHLITTQATGQGTVGIHAINDRYVLVTDSNALSLIVVDVLLGGIAGILTFPTKMYSKSKEDNSNTTSNNDIHFIGVTSCNTCLYIHVDQMHWQFPHSTKDHILEIGPLEKPLLDMANESNFTAFSSLSFERDMKPVWPFPEKYLNSKNADMRMIRSHPSGGVGYLARQGIGVLRYYLDSRGKMIPFKGDVFFRSDNKITGINFSSTYKRLVAVGKSQAYILDSTEKNLLAPGSYEEEDYNDNTTESNLIERITLHKKCIRGRYRNTVLWDDDPSSQVMFVDGHTGFAGAGGTGIVLQRLTRRGVNDNSNSTGKSTGKSWGNCEIVAGDPKQSVGWRDGCGSTVRFTRPHDMTLLPQSGKLIVTDIDNRALRLVQSSPLSNHNANDTNANANDTITDMKTDMTCVSTISYDEGLYMDLFPDSQVQKKMNQGSDYNSTKAASSIENMNKNTIVTAVSSDTIPLRRPYVLERPIEAGKITFGTAQAYCQSSLERGNSDICTLKEVRTLFHNVDDHGNEGNGNHDAFSIKNILSNPFWTKQSCEGCWKRLKGICVDGDPSWDNDYHMVAVGRNLDSQSLNERGLHTTCFQDDEHITAAFEYTHVVCCGDIDTEEKIGHMNEFEHSKMSTLSLLGTSFLLVCCVVMILLYFISIKVKRKNEMRYDQLESEEV